MKQLLFSLLVLSSLSTFAASEECEKIIDEVTIASFNVGTTLKSYEYAKTSKAKPEVIESLAKQRKDGAEYMAEIRARASETCK